MRGHTGRALLIFCCLSLFGSAQAKEGGPPRREGRSDKMTYLNTVHTYGGSPLLKKTFEGVSAIVYGNQTKGIGATFNAILRIATVIGCFCALMATFGAGRFEGFARSWLFTALFIFGILSVPRMTIHIDDGLAQKSGDTRLAKIERVDHVPYLYGTCISLISNLFNKFTRVLEANLHDVNDNVYNWTGHIYAGNDLLKSGQISLTSGRLRRNIATFCYDCIFNDTHLKVPRYTVDDLFNATDIMDFVAKRTHPMLEAYHIEKDGSEKRMSCRKFAETIRTELRGGGATSSAQPVFLANLSDKASVLFKGADGATMDRQRFLEQSFMIDAVQTDAVERFSAFRAKKLRQTQQTILGTLGRSVAAMGNLFEAIVYLAFPLVTVLALSYAGLKILFGWIQLLLWVSMWPPVYVIVNAFLQCIWEFRTTSFFGGKGIRLTIADSVGISELYESMQGLASVAIFLVPSLAFTLLKGGVHSLVHIANAMNAQGQMAASVAANEQTSGNYNFSNLSYENATFSQKQTAPRWGDNASLSDGTMSVGYGLDSVHSGEGERTAFRAGLHDPGFTASIEHTIGASLKKSASDARTHYEETARSSERSWQHLLKTEEGLLRAYEHDKAFSSVTDLIDQEEARRIYSDMQAEHETFTDTRTRQTDNLFSVGGTGVIGGGRTWHGLTDAQQARAYEHALSVEKNRQRLHAITDKYSHSEGDSESVRFSEEYGNSFNKCNRDMEAERKAKISCQVAEETHARYRDSQATFRHDVGGAFIGDLKDRGFDGDDISHLVTDTRALTRAFNAFVETSPLFKSQAPYGSPLLPDVPDRLLESVPRNTEGATEDKVAPVSNNIEGEGRERKPGNNTSSLLTRFDNRRVHMQETINEITVPTEIDEKVKATVTRTINESLLFGIGKKIKEATVDTAEKGLREPEYLRMACPVGIGRSPIRIRTPTRRETPNP
ncbi:MAG: conjugal transfer protein TraG N-terminal domain-containing protein [Simkaniaceae bacterium]|nr:conjugal transfer protein TraG N-terminal domain-containing protein [Simkaniaceae bacterium]